uniref:Uncharacterized protein n=1 Tax=Arundo donax TaxID=35708 RepID=A0A0A9H7R4_ARUDO
MFSSSGNDFLRIVNGK